MARMIEADICKQCKQRGYFRTPELNEQLYLHFAGYSKIENLSNFTHCRILWLEHNSIEEIENLEALLALRVLHLEHNALRGLGNCILPLLETLNVSHNFLSDLSGLRNFPNLQRLHAAHNDLDDTQLVHLSMVPNLTALDLSHNKLRDPERLLEVLLKLPKLASLQLSGNDAVRSVKSYRKKLICALPKLCHLDDMPVFENERRAAEAWGRGGREAEKAEYAKIRAEEAARRDEQRAFFNRFVADAKARGSTAGVETAYARTMRLAAEAEEAAEKAQREQEEAEHAAHVAAASAAPHPATRLNENGGTASLPGRAKAPSPPDSDDDDDIAIPGVAVPSRNTATKPSRPAAAHADPFANLAGGGGVDDEGDAESGTPDTARIPSEAEVLARMKLDDDTAEAFANVASSAGVDASVPSASQTDPSRGPDVAVSDDSSADDSHRESAERSTDDGAAPVVHVEGSGLATESNPVTPPVGAAEAAPAFDTSPSGSDADSTSPPADEEDTATVTSSAMATPRPVPVE